MQTEYKNCSYKDLRKFNHEYQTQDVMNLYSIDINSFSKNPYTYLKSRYFLELSTIIVYFLRKSNITPNIISFCTALSGIIGGIFILTTNPNLIVLGLFFFFNGYVFDWCDGLLARVTGKSWLTGKYLDDWSTHFFALAFRLFIGLYVATNTSSLFFFFVPFVIFLSAIDIKTYFQSLMFTDLQVKKLKFRNYKIKPLKENNRIKLNNAKDFVEKYLKHVLFLSSFLDDRSRTIDLVCLLILFEQFFNLKIVWLYFVLLLLKEFFRFIINVLTVIRSGWYENKIESNH